MPSDASNHSDTRNSTNIVNHTDLYPRNENMTNGVNHVPVSNGIKSLHNNNRQQTIFDKVRQSTHNVIQHAQHVTINNTAIDTELTTHAHRYTTDALPPTWAQNYHYCNIDNPAATAQYVLVLDSLNYCFWPCDTYEYVHLASSLKSVLEHDIHAFDAENLINLTANQLQQWLQPLTDIHTFKHIQPDNTIGLHTTDSNLIPIPLLQQRVESLQEVGYALKQHFDGQCINMLKQCNHSANTLISLILQHLPMYRDHCISYNTGEQVHLYKRAQIFIGDIYGAFNGRDYGYFTDLDQLTCFADYRIPQLLRHMNILQYSTELQQLIDTQQLIPAGSQYEIQIRAATVQTVDYIQKQLKLKNIHMLSLQLDWLLWERGEAMLGELQPHHRTLTVYY